MTTSGYDAYTNFSASDQRFEAIKTLMNSELNTKIVVPTGTGSDRKMITIPAFMTREISIGGLGNEWKNILDFSMFQPIFDQLNSITNLLNTYATAEGDNSGGGAQVTLQSRHMTAASWRGSTIPTFTIPLTFLSLSPEQNPLDTFLALCRCVLPNSYEETKGANQGKVLNNTINGLSNSVSGIAIVGQNTLRSLTNGEQLSKADEAALKSHVSDMIQGGILEAPCGYGLNAKDMNNYMSPRKNTTLQLKVGRWLNAPNLLVNNLGGVVISRQTMKGTGYPLYVNCSLSLRPYKMVTFKEFLDYFPGVKRKENY